MLLLYGGATAQTPAESTAERVESNEVKIVPAENAEKAELERQFREMLTGAVFEGTWQMTGEEGLKGRAPLGEAKPDKYTISSATKLFGDRWLVTARVEYGDKDVTVPVPVRVVWAEDTPIITLNEINMPMLGKYSARVMVYRNFYCGTWFGDCYGGIMSGRIFHPDNKAAEVQPESDGADAAKSPRHPPDRESGG